MNGCVETSQISDFSIFFASKTLVLPNRWAVEGLRTTGRTRMVDSSFYLEDQVSYISFKWCWPIRETEISKPSILGSNWLVKQNLNQGPQVVWERSTNYFNRETNSFLHTFHFNFDQSEQNNFLNQPFYWPIRATEVVWIAILADLAKTSYLKDHRTYGGD